jgi:hypothetical protein
LTGCGIASPGTSSTGDGVASSASGDAASTGGTSSGGVSAGGTGNAADGTTDASTDNHGDSTGDSACASGGAAGGSTQWSDCAPGEYVKAEGTATTDRECAPCEAGSFSSVDNASSCTPWTVCSPGYIQAEPGTATRNRTCTSDAWVRQFGTGPDDGLRAIAVDANENVIVVGIVGGALPGQTSAGSYDAFVRKYDRAGTESWTRQFGSPASDAAESVTVDGDGNVYVSGEAAAALPGQTSAGASDVFVTKFDASGAELWTRQFGSSGFDLGFVSVDAKKNVTVSGFAQNALPGQTVPATESGAPGYLFVRKYDGSGGELWTRQFGSTTGQYIFGSAKVDAAGNVYFAGATDGALPGQTNAGEQDAFLRKYDASGTELWTRQFGTRNTEGGQAVSVDTDGSIYVAGRTFGAFPNQVNAGGPDAYVSKFDGEGNEIWTRQFGTSAVDVATSVSADGAGILYVGGSTSGTLPGQLSAGSVDAFVRKYDGAGVERGTRQFGTAEVDSGISIAVFNSLYVGGNTNGTFVGFPNANPGLFDAFVAKLSAF